jgi:H+/Cl- antiporter ClcA
VIISSIGTAAGAIILLSSLLAGNTGGQTSPEFFAGIRWVALMLTLGSALVLAWSLNQFRPHREAGSLPRRRHR